MSRTWNLSISPDTVCYQDQPDDPVDTELESTISAMNVDEQIDDLVALCWLGRGDDILDDWERIRAEAADAHNEHTAAYLIGTPLLADYLEEAMAHFGTSIASSKHQSIGLVLTAVKGAAARMKMSLTPIKVARPRPC